MKIGIQPRLLPTEILLIGIYLVMEVAEFIFPLMPEDSAWKWLSYDYAKRIMIVGVILWSLTHRRLIRLSFATPWPLHEGAPLGLIRLTAIVIGLCVAQVFIEWGRIWSYSFLPDIRTNYPPHTIEPVAAWFDLTIGLALVAVSEEFVFRSIACDVLKRFQFSERMIILFSSILFAATHLSTGLPTTFAAMATGATFMFVYLRTRSLWPTLTAHYFINLWYFTDLWQV